MSLVFNFSKNLKKLRTDRKLSIAKFSNEIGVCKTTLQNFEARRGNPTLATVSIIECNLNLSEGEILSKPGDKKLPEIDYLYSLISLARMKPETRKKALHHINELALLLSDHFEN